MKKKFYLFMLLCGACATSCIDPEYDLSNISTDNIAIGDESSQFEIPLVQVLVGMDELKDEDLTAIDGIFDEADTWLPTQLPQGEECIHVQQLTTDTEYTDELLEQLLTEMAEDPDKLEQVATLLEEKYIDSFQDIPDIDPNRFKEDFIQVYTTNEQVRELLNERVKTLANNYLTGIDLNLSGLTYTIDNIDLGDDVVDMLTENLDPEETEQPKNTLHLVGTIDNNLPVSFTATPVFLGTDVTFTAKIAANQSGNEIPETKVSADDLRTIVNGTSIEITVTIDKYYPGRGFNRGAGEEDQPQITINLHLNKRGGLKFDI